MMSSRRGNPAVLPVKTAYAVKVDGVSRVYGEQQVPALRDVSFEVKHGEFVALMGPSGCGKSTLLNLIGAMDQPTEGTLSVSGMSLGQLDDDALTEVRRTQVGYIFQFFNLLNTLTVAENVALPLELNGELSPAQIQAKVDQWLEEVHLGHRASYYPAKLSGGEMQRVAIARALIHGPSLILADEPTGNLDSENGHTILSLLSTLATRHHKTILMATHSEEAAQGASRVIRLKDGRLISDHRVGRE